MAKIFVDSNALAAAASLLRRLGATEVFLFGSATKDGLQPDSDIDMAVRGLPPSVYFSAISKITSLLGRQVDLVDLDDATPIVRYLLGSGDLVVSPELPAKIRVGLEELAIVRQQFELYFHYHRIRLWEL